MNGSIVRHLPHKHRDAGHRTIAMAGFMCQLGIAPGSEVLRRVQLVVAAQSGIPSGSLHMVGFAIEQNKTLAVPRPKPPWETELQSAGNMALTDPDGCNSEELSAKGSLADKIRGRRPAVDIVLTDRSDIDRILTSR